MNDNDKSKSKYNRLYTEFYNKIISGEWKNGQKILPERQLCEEFNVSRITVRETLRLLANQGSVSRIQGRGTFVQARPYEQKLTKLYTLREHFEKMGINSTAKILTYKIIKSDIALSKKLNILPGNETICITRIFYAAKNPYTLETTFLPLEVFPGISKDMIKESGLYNSFRLLGITITKAVERLQPILLDEPVSKQLNEEPNSVAMRINRTTYSGDDIIEYTESLVPGGFFIYTVELS